MSALKNDFFDYPESKPNRADRQVRLFIADRDDQFRAALQKKLQSTPRFQLVGEAADGPNAVWQAASLHPHVLVISADMRGSDGHNAIKTVKELLPNCKIVALIDPASDEEICASIAAGADGCCSRKVFYEDLKTAVTSVAGGSIWYDPTVRHSLERACSKGLKLSNSADSMTLTSVEPNDEMIAPHALCHQLQWYERRKWITTLHWIMVALFAVLALVSAGPLVKSVLNHVNSDHSNNTISAGGPTATIPGIAYTLFELQCRTWHRYRGTPAFNLTAN